MQSAAFVTVKLTIPIDPANQELLRTTFADLSVLEKSMAIAGAIDTWTAEAHGCKDALTVFSRWTSIAGYEAWCSDPRRDEIVQGLSPLLAHPMESTMYVSASEPVTSESADDRQDGSLFAIRYRFDASGDTARQELLPTHVAWLQQEIDDGFIISSGAWYDGTGALILARCAGNTADVRERMKHDPFFLNGLVAEVLVDEWVPSFGILS